MGCPSLRYPLLLAVLHLLLALVQLRLQLVAVTGQALYLLLEVRRHLLHHLVDLPLVALLFLQDPQPRLQPLVLFLKVLHLGGGRRES